MDNEQHRLSVLFALDFDGDDFERPAPLVSADPLPRRGAPVGSSDAGRGGVGQNPANGSSTDPMPPRCLGEPDFHSTIVSDRTSYVQHNGERPVTTRRTGYGETIQSLIHPDIGQPV